MPSYVNQVRAGLLDWLESVRHKADGWGRWKYNRHACRAYALESSRSALLILGELGSLASVPADHRAQAIAWIQSCQDPADGYFKDPLVTEADRVGDMHSWEHIWAHMSSVAGALERLGGRPLHPLRQHSFVDLSRVDPAEFTESMDWANPWLYSEQWAKAVMAFARQLPADQPPTDHPLIVRAFDAYEHHVLNARTGYPDLRCDEPSFAMAGLFKAMTAYLAIGRAVPYARQAIDSTLALQHNDGEFGIRHNMCVNWDAVWVLLHLDEQLNHTHRLADIQRCGNALADHLLAHYRQSDGGFAFHGTHCIPKHNSVRTSDPLPEGDMVGTKMALLSLSYADQWNAPG